MLQAHYPREHFKDASRIFPLDNIGLDYYSVESRELPPRDNKNAFNYIAANYYYRGEGGNKERHPVSQLDSFLITLQSDLGEDFTSKKISLTMMINVDRLSAACPRTVLLPSSTGGHFNSKRESAAV